MYLYGLAPGSFIFQVADYHTYHVGNNGILVHNAGVGYGGVRGYTGSRNHNADFKNGKKLADHFNRYGSDFGCVDEADYLSKTNSFFGNPPSTIESFTSDGGTYFRYDTATNTFGIMNQYGGISTFYKPPTGVKYWLEQVAKYGTK